jgi:anti-sigma factor RsiW
MNGANARTGSVANGGSAEGPPPSDEELMLWVDGETDERRGAEVEAFVAKNPRARAVVVALRQAASMVASDALERAEARGADSIVDDVMAALDEDAPNAPVVPLRPRGIRRIPRAALGFVAAAAAAALVALFPRAPEHSVATGATTTGPNVLAFSGAVVDIVDFGARAGTIFYVPSDDDSAMAVVWVTEDDTNPSGGESL